MRRGLKGQFRLGMQPGNATVAPILSIALAKKAPLLQQSILIANFPSLLRAIRDHEVDTALAYLDNLTGEKFDTHLLYREQFFLFQTGNVKRPPSVTWDDLLTRPLCLLNASLPDIAHSRLAQSTTHGIRTDSMDVVAAQIATGKYSAVLPQSLAGHLAQIPRLQAIAIKGPGSRASVGFIAGKNAFDAPSLRAFLELVVSPELAARLRAVVSVDRRLRPKKTAPGAR